MKHIKQIDGLRFIAVFFVLIEHFASAIGKYISAGYFGVDLFFVISGFLITNILLNNNENFIVAYKKFLGRRTLRIFPVYYLTVFILLILNQTQIKQYLVNYLTYSFNYAWVYYNIPNSGVSHFWSLCVEEQFYLFWPFIVLLMRNNLKAIKYVILTLIFISFAQMSLNIFPLIQKYNQVGLFPRAGSLAMGAFGVILIKENKLPFKILNDIKAEIFMLLLLIINLIIDYKIKYPLLAICSLFFILKAYSNSFKISSLNSFLSNKFIIYIGTISYGIYVFHFPIDEYFTKYIFNPYFWLKINFNYFGKFKIIEYHPWLIKFPLYSFLSIVLAHYSYKYFEKPILKLKDKMFKYN